MWRKEKLTREVVHNSWLNEDESEGEVKMTKKKMKGETKKEEWNQEMLMKNWRKGKENNETWSYEGKEERKGKEWEDKGEE